MTGWKGVLKSIKDFSKDIASAPSGRQVRLLTAASDRGKQYLITGARSDLEEAISAHKAVLDNPPRDPETRTAVYVSLVAHLKAKYVREGAEDDTLDELIWASQALVELTQEHDPKLLDRLQSLVLCLRLRFDKKKKNYDDVKETIRVLQRCLGAPQLANPIRIKLLDTLAAVLVKQAKHAEESGRQEESIAVIRARAGNTLLENPDRTTSAHRDLDVAINVNEWLVLPENSNFVGGVMNQARLSNTLGLLYGSRWSHTRAASDICRGIAHLRNALSNARDADKAIFWHNLGLLLLISGRVLNADQDLDEAIQCFQESMKLEHPANLQNLHHRIEQAKSIKASFRPDHALEFSWNILPNSPQDGSEFQQSVDGSSTQPNALPSFLNWADEFEEVAKQRLESETIPRNGSLQFEEQLIDPSQTSDVTTVAQATRHKDATIEVSKVEDFLKQWRSRQIELLIAYRYSPTYEKLLDSIRDEYRRFKGLRFNLSLTQPLSIWQKDVESWLETIDKEREATFTDFAATSDERREKGLYPLSMLLFLHDRDSTKYFAQRRRPYKAVMENWERIQSLYKESSRFRGTLSRPQEHSFGVLIDWWSSKYTHDLDINDFHRQFRSLLEHPPSFDLQAYWYRISWTSHSVYHSSCLELFFRELHPFSWEPFARYTCLSALGITRNLAYRVALKQRYAWASFENSAKGKSLELARVQEIYPQYFHESRIMGENPLLEKEELRHWGDSMSTFMDIRQWDGRSPAYLWDTKNRVTTMTDRISTPLDYICVSHTWGRWRKPGVYVHVEGVPWPVPANTLYDVEDLPSILERFLAPTERYIWIDLFCMPQGDFDPAKLGIEIDKQASIFGRSQRCIAWLHDVEEWTGVTNAMRYMAATYVRNSSTDDGRGLGLLITQEQLQTSHADADRHMELMEAGKWAPSTWFSSLWTLQEAVLCPDLQLCSKKMEILKDGRDCPIGLRTLFMITTSHPDLNLTIPVSSTLSMSDAAPNTRLPLSVLGFEDLSKLTRFGSLLLHLYPTDVLIQTSVRQCTESRAPAIMSALAITDWDKTYDESTINQSLILNSFPLQFVQAAARKIGTTFFYNYSSGPQKSMAERSALRHERDVGSMLPFSEPNELRTTIKMGAMDDLILKPIDHESVASWSILPDGAVNIPSASIMASSDSTTRSEALIEASIPLDPRDGLPDLGHLKDPNTSLIDLKKGLVELAGDKYDCFAVVLFEDLGRQHGIVLRGPHTDGGATRQLIKIGLFRTYDSMKPPESVAVSWKVL